MLAVYDRRRGWLTTRSSIIKGGRHGEPALIELPVEEIQLLLTPDIQTGLRAMQNRWFKG